MDHTQGPLLGHSVIPLVGDQVLRSRLKELPCQLGAPQCDLIPLRMPDHRLQPLRRHKDRLCDLGQNGGGGAVGSLDQIAPLHRQQGSQDPTERQLPAQCLSRAPFTSVMASQTAVARADT